MLLGLSSRGRVDPAVTVPIATDAFGQFERLSFVSRRRARAGLGGEHRSRRHSPSTDFVDYRPYQPGDDFRRVDWNVFGRLGSLHVKVTEARESLDIVLILDCSSSMAYGQPDKLGFATQLVAALGYVGMARLDSVRIVCLAEQNAPGPGGLLNRFGRRASTPDLVRQLSQVAPCGWLDVNAQLSTCLPDAARQPLVVVVSDLLVRDGVSLGLTALQARQADMVVLHVVSPDEVDPRLTGEVELIDAETNEVLEVGVSLETLSAYRARFATWLDEREAECQTRGIRYARLMTDRPLASVVLDDLRAAGVLR
jgi:Protein of unknown function DUF58